jgi:hypothetical protein
VNKYKGKDIQRALALVHKIARGISNDEMLSVYRGLIETGGLRMKKVQHQNTLCRWMNDPRLTPILQDMLALTAKPFRAIESAGIIDSSKMSQVRSAHSRWIEYGDDERDAADWMKLHALVGAESLVCMAAMFSGTKSDGGKYLVHDSKFMLPLVDKVVGVFSLRYLLGDKAYLSEQNVGGLWERGIQAVIPIKKNWDFKNAKLFYEPLQHLVRWYDKEQPDFHEFYRCRVKVESFFSLVKRVTEGFCWSRGRPRTDANGKPLKDDAGNVIPLENAVTPCDAWINETLCKVIYVNMRLTVEREIATGYRMNYATDTFFPAMPADQKLIA